MNTGLLDSNEPEVSSNRSSLDTSGLEQALMRHLAFMGELADRRETLQAELNGVLQLFQQARHRRLELLQAIHTTGGTLPTLTE